MIEIPVLNKQHTNKAKSGNKVFADGQACGSRKGIGTRNLNHFEGPAQVSTVCVRLGGEIRMLWPRYGHRTVTAKNGNLLQFPARPAADAALAA